MMVFVTRELADPVGSLMQFRKYPVVAGFVDPPVVIYVAAFGVQ